MAKLKVTVGYRGRKTNEQFIAPGIHETEENPLVAEHAKFLVATGRAHWLDGVPPELLNNDEEDGDPTPPARDDLTVLDGIGDATADKLYELEVYTVYDLAHSTAEVLGPSMGIGVNKAQQYIDAALTYLEAEANG